MFLERIGKSNVALCNIHVLASVKRLIRSNRVVKFDFQRALLLRCPLNEKILNVRKSIQAEYIYVNC